MSERRYGQWSGNPRGHAEDPGGCIESVPNPAIARGMVFKQCDRMRGFGKDQLYCKQHARKHPAEPAGEGGQE